MITALMTIGYQKAKPEAAHLNAVGHRETRSLRKIGTV